MPFLLHHQSAPLAFMGLGPIELAIVGVVAVLLFGSRLPQVARSAGKSLTEFKRGMQDLQDDVRRSMDAEEYAASQPRRLESKGGVIPNDDEPMRYPDPRSPLDETSEAGTAGAEATKAKPVDSATDA